MCRLLKAFKSYLNMVLTLIIFGTCNSSVLYVREGEAVQLNFSYPCDVTKATLRHGYKAPFYDSADPQSNALPPRYELGNHSKLDSNDSCYLQLTISPVSRNDEGTYTLSVYNHSQLLPEYPRIGLRVDYPPDQASCGSSDPYIEGEWIKIQCSAKIGDLPGQIICYQNGKRLPPLTSPEGNGGTLNQIIMARLDGLVYCCFSPLRETVDLCECNDIGWDPIQNRAIIKIKKPCTPPTIVQQNTKDSESVITASNSHQATSPTTTKTDRTRSFTFLAIVTVALAVTSFVLAVLYCRKVRQTN